MSGTIPMPPVSAAYLAVGAWFAWGCCAKHALSIESAPAPARNFGYRAVNPAPRLRNPSLPAKAALLIKIANRAGTLPIIWRERRGEAPARNRGGWRSDRILTACTLHHTGNLPVPGWVCYPPSADAELRLKLFHSGRRKKRSRTGNLLSPRRSTVFGQWQEVSTDAHRIIADNPWNMNARPTSKPR